MFKRGVDAKEALGVGDFAPKIKELKVILSGMIESQLTIWSSDGSMDAKTKVIEWKSILGKDESNLHRLVALVHTTNVSSFKAHINNLKHQMKGVFAKRDLKFTVLNSVFTERYFRSFGFSKDNGNIIIEIIYSKIKKK